RFRAARLARVEERRRLVAHEVRRLQVGVRARDGELYALVLADGPVEHHALFRVAGRLVDEPVAVAYAFRGDERALGVQPIEYVLEAPTLVTDQVLGWHFQVLEKELVRLLVRHVADRLDRKPVAHGAPQIHDEDGKSFRFALHLGDGRSARQEEQQVRMPD